VGHAPTTIHKGTKAILTELYPYQQAGTITVDIITDVPWHQCQERKAQCHIFIDQYTIHDPNPEIAKRGAIGVNAIESLYYGSIVLANPLHPYLTHHYPTLPPIFPFLDELDDAINKPHAYNKDHFIRWAKDYFDISTQAPKLKELIQWISS
jgi:hypothetical protein